VSNDHSYTPSQGTDKARFVIEGDQHISFIVRQRPIEDDILSVGAKEVKHFRFYIGTSFRGANVVAALICAIQKPTGEIPDEIYVTFRLKVSMNERSRVLKRFRIYSHQIGDRSGPKGDEHIKIVGRRAQVVTEYLGESPEPPEQDKWTSYRLYDNKGEAKVVPSLEPEVGGVLIAINLRLGFYLDVDSSEQSAETQKPTSIIPTLSIDGKQAKLNQQGNRERVLNRTGWTIIKHKIRRPLVTERQNENKDHKASTPAKKSIKDKRLVILSSHDLRQVGVNISYRVSWERTMTDLLLFFARRETKSTLFGLEDARYIVMTFGVNGLALFTRASDTEGIEAAPYVTGHLIYSGSDIEGSLEQLYGGDRLSLDSRIAALLAITIDGLESRSKAAEKDFSPDDIRCAFLRTLKGAHALRRTLFKLGYDFHDCVFGNPFLPLEYIGAAKRRDHEIDMASFVSEVFKNLNSLPLEEQVAIIGETSTMAMKEYDVITTACYSEDGLANNTGKLQRDLKNSRKPPNDFAMTDQVNKYREKFNLFRQTFRQEWLEADVADSVSASEIGWQLSNNSVHTVHNDYNKYPWSYLGLKLKTLSEKSGKDPFGSFVLRASELAHAMLEWGGPGETHWIPYGYSVPYAVFGDLVLFDRKEIESLRGLRFVIEEYDQQKSLHKPLNLAAFGDPGSGKSFAVEQLIRSLNLSKNVEFLTFNLSMFDSIDSLIPCFRQIQTLQLNNKLPVVFWDEFDTTLNGTPFGWLHAFLGPMQDGRYVDSRGGVNIGRCIFVFAGSRFRSFDELPDPRLPGDPPREEVIVISVKEAQEGFTAAQDGPSSLYHRGEVNLARKKEDWRVAKGGDFQSRLKGSLDILDANPGPKELLKWSDDKPNAIGVADWKWDSMNFLVRRARLVRNILMKKGAGYDSLFEAKKKDIGDAEPSKHLRIEPSIAWSFLSPSIFIHGTRSIESVIQMSCLQGKVSYDRPWLPPAELLKHHVSPKAFEYGSLTDDEKIEAWRELLREESKRTPP